MKTQAGGAAASTTSRPVAELPIRPLTSLIAIVMLASFPVVLTGAMSVEMRADIAFDSTSLGLAVTAYYLTSAMLSSWCGILVERIGPTLTLRGAGALAALACAGITLSSTLEMLTLFLIIGGASVSLAQPASNAVIMQTAAPHRRGLAFGIKQSAIPGGTALAGIAIPVVALTLGWRAAFIGAAIAALAAMVLVPELSRPVHRGQRVRGELRESYAMLWLLAVAAALSAASAMSLPVFLTSSAVERGLTSTGAGLLLAAGSVGGLVVRLVVGARADRRSGGHLQRIALLMMLGTIGLLGMTSHHAVLFATATMLAFGAGWAWQGLFNHAVTNRWPQSPAAATGITQTGVFVGGIIGPPTFGWMAGRWSDAVGWCTLGLMMAAGMVLVLMVRRLPLPGAGHDEEGTNATV